VLLLIRNNKPKDLYTILYTLIVSKYHDYYHEKGEKMTIDETISAEELKDRLTDLATYMSEERPKVYAVASYLASRLGDGELSPRSFVEAFELMFLDMQRGIDGYTGNPLPEELRDPFGIAYFTASRKIQAIAEAICPKKFADLVKQETIKTDEDITRWPLNLPALNMEPRYSDPALGVRPAKTASKNDKKK